MQKNTRTAQNSARVFTAASRTFAKLPTSANHNRVRKNTRTVQNSVRVFAVGRPDLVAAFDADLVEYLQKIVNNKSLLVCPTLV